MSRGIDELLRCRGVVLCFLEAKGATRWTALIKGMMDLNLSYGQAVGATRWLRKKKFIDQEVPRGPYSITTKGLEFLRSLPTNSNLFSTLERADESPISKIGAQEKKGKEKKR
ncbi:MAG: hypothetical protein KAJ19_17670 [Gammaproteobacteria bacterium]|nr:hypothetical protein [Gammaproteobacteria bacterium]